MRRAWRFAGRRDGQACAADILYVQMRLRGTIPRTPDRSRAGSKRMKTDTPRPILLKDYRPPNYLIYAVNLDVSLHATRTRVRARLKIRRNPAYPGNPGPLRLDGEMIELESVRLDGRQLGPARVRAHRHGARHRRPAQGALHARDHHLLQPGGQQGADGALPVARHLLHAMRGPGVPAHHLLPGPPGRARHLYACASRPTAARPRCCSSNGDPAGARHARRRQAALRGVARSPSQALLPVRAGRRQPRLLRLRLHDRLGAQGGPAHLRGARQGGPLRLGDGFAQALHALGRGALRARVRPRRVQHRRRVGLQHGGDGEQGPQHLQRRADPGLARDRHRLQLRGHRAGDRARVLPQLDRQPHHLPRLVPALPQGRPHRLPRPGVLRRPALLRPSSASATCAT